ncbi:hypothetical protein EVAR_16655_1 [Eumeta japonica]|uniref:Uncharacterized protein n=1 Tax=Eumeta variegata TaxID=151549 RepID=A0A4C1V059_EUMVA|nr:hypothetical protein EVAR_16655_1 [Eumeta japonica]
MITLVGSRGGDCGVAEAMERNREWEGAPLFLHGCIGSAQCSSSRAGRRGRAPLSVVMPSIYNDLRNVMLSEIGVMNVSPIESSQHVGEPPQVLGICVYLAQIAPQAGIKKRRKKNYSATKNVLSPYKSH